MSEQFLVSPASEQSCGVQAPSVTRSKFLAGLVEWANVLRMKRPQVTPIM